MRRVNPDVLARFVASYLVKQMPGVDPKLGPCHVWQGSTNQNGYGLFSPTGGRHSRRVVAHKFIFELFEGPVPDGFDLDHKCRVRPCANRTHVQKVTHQVNLFLGERGSATHCKHGHPLPPPRLGVKRRCRVCAQLSKLRSRQNRQSGLGPNGRA